MRGANIKRDDSTCAPRHHARGARRDPAGSRRRCVNRLAAGRAPGRFERRAVVRAAQARRTSAQLGERAGGAYPYASEQRARRWSRASSSRARAARAVRQRWPAGRVDASAQGRRAAARAPDPAQARLVASIEQLAPARRRQLAAMLGEVANTLTGAAGARRCSSRSAADAAANAPSEPPAPAHRPLVHDAVAHDAVDAFGRFHRDAAPDCRVRARRRPRTGRRTARQGPARADCASTNLFYFGRFSTDGVTPADAHLGWMMVAIPVIGGLIIGVMARYGSSAFAATESPRRSRRS